MCYPPTVTQSAVFASHALVRRIEAAGAHSLESLAHAALGEVWVAPIAGGVALYREPGSPFNKVAGVGFVPLTAAEWQQLERAFEAHAAPVQVEVASYADPALTNLLVERGYRFGGCEVVLGRNLNAPFEVPVTQVGVRAATEDTRAQWIEVLTAAAAVSDEDEPQPEHNTFDRSVLERAYRDIAGDANNLRWLALLDQHVVGGASMSVRDGIAQLNGAATLPSARRRGVQTALLWARLAYARASGCEVAVITTQPGSKSQQNAQRAGFTPLYERALWLRPART
jgi:GNAT superfamily N-acetyltransferase